jgi:hypothetical protein
MGDGNSYFLFLSISKLKTWIYEYIISITSLAVQS